MSVAMRHGIVSAVGRVAVYPVMLAGECERASDCKPPMPWSERGWAPTGPSWSGRALTCRTGHCSFVTDGDNSTSALHAISAWVDDPGPSMIVHAAPERVLFVVCVKWLSGVSSTR